MSQIDKLFIEMDRFDNATQFYDAKQRNLLTKGER